MDEEMLGLRLWALRDDRPREEVARALGISVAALTAYENGERVPRDEVKVRIASYYKQSLRDLFFPDEDTHRERNRGTEEPPGKKGVAREWLWIPRV